MPTLLVETVTARSTAELRAARDRVTDADLVELRLDGVSDPDVAGALRDRTRPVIVTCRPVWEGGRFDGSEDVRLGLLGEAMRLGAEFVDVEFRANRRSLPRDTASKLVLSSHDFEGVPGDLAARARAMRAERPAVTKIAMMATTLADCLKLHDAEGESPSVLIAMGAAGLVTRLLPAAFGSCWTYAGSAVPGQISAREMAGRYRVRETSRATQLFAIAGRPLAHSASPAMHNSAFAALGLDAVYVPLETADAAELIRVADAFGLRGASITVPLKTAVFSRARVSSARAQAIGAINTLRRTESGWEGENFDVDGFLAPLDRRKIDLRGVRTVVLGGGGAARAVVAALQSRGAAVAVSTRRRDQAEALAGAFGADVVRWPPRPGWDLLVNTTPVGMAPDAGASPIPRALVQGPRVYDLIYAPAETTLLAWARQAGAETFSGLEMLVAQGQRQFAWWTGRTPPADVLERAAREFLGQRQMETSPS